MHYQLRTSSNKFLLRLVLYSRLEISWLLIWRFCSSLWISQECSGLEGIEFEVTKAVCTEEKPIQFGI